MRSPWEAATRPGGAAETNQNPFLFTVLPGLGYAVLHQDPILTLDATCYLSLLMLEKRTSQVDDISLTGSAFAGGNARPGVQALRWRI